MPPKPHAYCFADHFARLPGAVVALNFDEEMSANPFCEAFTSASMYEKQPGAVFNSICVDESRLEEESGSDQAGKSGNGYAVISVPHVKISLPVFTHKLTISIIIWISSVSHDV